jgi:hypothetical protein
VLLKYGPDAKTNNLVNYDEIKDLNLEEYLKTIKKAKSDRELPQNISKIDKYYCVIITYNKKVNNLGYYQNLEKAIKVRDEFREKIKTLEDKIKEVHLEREILRNSNNQAIIPLKNKKQEIVGSAIVDDDKWHDLMNYKWFFTTTNYVASYINSKTTLMHIYLMKKEDNDERIIDHINNIKHDNRLSNLRFSTFSQNCHNRVKKEGTISKYHGVSYFTIDKIWRASFVKDNITYYIGRFKNEIDAAKAYNKKAKEVYGKFARLNIFEDEPSTDIDEEEPSIDITNLNKVDEIKEIKERKTRFRGVTLDKNRYSAEIFKDNIRYYLGTYGTEEDAAKAYNKKAKELYGDRASLNDVEGDIEIVGHKTKSSKYRGVSYKKKLNKWLAVIYKDYKEIYVGIYKTEEEAALAYNIKAIEIHGDKAILNDVEGDVEIIVHKPKSSKYRGVFINKKSNNWIAEIRKDKKKIRIGTYKTEEEAALAYNKKAIEVQGDKAKLNVI